MYIQAFTSASTLGTYPTESCFVGHPGGLSRGLADGHNWAVRTIMNKFHEEFEAKVSPTYVPVKVSVGASAKG